MVVLAETWSKCFQRPIARPFMHFSALWRTPALKFQIRSRECLILSATYSVRTRCIGAAATQAPVQKVRACDRANSDSSQQPIGLNAGKKWSTVHQRRANKQPPHSRYLFAVCDSICAVSGLAAVFRLRPRRDGKTAIYLRPVTVNKNSTRKQ